MSKKSGKSKVRPETEVDLESSCEESANEDFDDFEEEEASNSSAIVKFSSALSPHSSTDSSDAFESLHLDEQMVIDSLAPPPFVEPLFSPSPIVLATVPGVSPATYCQTLQPPLLPLFDLSTKTLDLSISDPGLSILRPSSRFFSVGPLMKYHQQNISYAHYFRYFDYPKLYSETILAMAQQSDALLHAVAAFSALIWSIKTDPSYREPAFWLYSGACVELKRVISNPKMDSTDCHFAVATALQLASFDVGSISSIGNCSDILATRPRRFGI